MEILHSSQGQICSEQFGRIRLKFFKNNSMTDNKKFRYKSHSNKKYDRKRKQLMRYLLSKDICNYKFQHSLTTWAIHVQYLRSRLQHHDMSGTMTNTVSVPLSLTLFFQYHVNGKCLIRKLSYSFYSLIGFSS